MEKDVRREADASISEADRVHRHTGAKNHLITFVVSLLLTALAFVAVASGTVERGTLVWLLLFLAFVQALFQLYIWMHMEQKGHGFAALCLYSGAGVALVTVISFVLWVWW
ncbi:cytochrome C oxidase subunit IV family protein [Brevibacillus marinus]|jgi:cytochrome c oxidase subunit 4|uniref:cytochrome C oxidase subunit IV family protein n=1 Tax=Brevibacillus marinus TaxID=2496837 RepID=UPI000F832FBB|nr:cytochrome C oxidase subunit IV family protein [Brevibacillus marinus]